MGSSGTLPDSDSEEKTEAIEPSSLGLRVELIVVVDAIVRTPGPSVRYRDVCGNSALRTRVHEMLRIWVECSVS